MSKDIKKALEHCIEWDCVDCPNREELGSGETVCRGRLLTEVLEYVADLEAKLSESENKVKGFVELFDKKQHENYEQFCEIMQLKQQLTEIKNQKAIAELEKLRKQLDCEDNYCYGDNNIVICINRTIFNNIINQQIKLLKGEKLC